MTRFDHLVAVILAGGSGTRLWPFSRSLFPKQLLTFGGGSDSLLQATARRLLPLTGRIITVTGRDHRFEVAGQLHAIQPELANHVLAEPVGRNTLPAAAWATALANREDPDAVIGVFPADHLVGDLPGFSAAIARALPLAREGYLVTFGLAPTAPETGYGYIQQGDPLPGEGCRRVARFVEKPDLETARGYLASGDYLWNSGMFLFAARTLLAALARHEPLIHAGIVRLLAGEESVEQVYAQLPGQSLDYGIMEKSDNLAVVVADFDWSDLGSWEAVYQRGEKDAQGNVTAGQVFALDARDNLLMANDGLVAALGVEGLVVVRTDDAVLVSTRAQVQQVNQVVAHLRAQGSSLARVHNTVHRPWGSYTVLEEGPGFKIKRIEVKPGARLSLQMHHHRSEHWVVVSGTARIWAGEREILLHENQSVYIPKTERHRLENPGLIPLQIIEVQSGLYLGEDDIVRFEDNYGRE